MLNPLDLIDRLHAITAKPLLNPRPLAAYLRSRHYSPLAIDQTLRCLGEGWSVAEIWWINEDHRPAVERLLGHEGECGCDECTDEAAFRSGLLRPSGRRMTGTERRRNVVRTMASKPRPRVGDKCWVVEWCIKQGVDEDDPGSHDPDKDVYRTRSCATREEAERIAREVFPKDQRGAVEFWPAEFMPYADEEAERYPHVGYWDATADAEWYDGEDHQ